MGKKVRIQLAPKDRDWLEALIANGNTAQKHVRRARIVVLAGDGIGTDEIHRRLRVSKPTIRRWRTRYIEAGVDGLCRDKTRPPGKAPLGPKVINRVLEKTLTEVPPDATHWSLRTMAKAVGIAPSSVQAIWKAHGLKPHLVATFKLSNDPRFAEKVEDVVGLYLNPPERAIVLSVDEKSQSLTRNEFIDFKPLRFYGRGAGCWRSEAMLRRFRWFPRSPWRGVGCDRTRRTSVRRPIVGATARSLWPRPSA